MGLKLHLDTCLERLRKITGSHRVAGDQSEIETYTFMVQDPCVTLHTTHVLNVYGHNISETATIP
jgi:hypothetical protein